jgi:predicted DNA-binding transcriptional regulator YafY
MLFKHINRLQQIDQLIRQRSTGNAEELAGKLEISRRQVYNWLDELKSFGLEVIYDREQRSYVYLKHYRLHIIFDVKEVSKEDAISHEMELKN